MPAKKTAPVKSANPVQRISRSSAHQAVQSKTARSLPAQGHTFPSSIAAPVVQRVLNTQEQHFPEAIRNKLRNQVKAFNNNKNEKSNKKVDLHHQFELLDRLEQTVHIYLRDHSDTISNAERTELFSLLRQVELDHVQLTKRNINAGHDIWLRNRHSLSGSKYRSVQNLWHSIRTGKGNIKIEEHNAGFRDSTLSSFARILQGEHGRGMVGKLNHKQGPGKGILISDNHAPYFNQIAGNHKPGSWAEDYGGLHGQQNLHHGTPGNPGVGTGSYVQIDSSQPATADDYQLDKNENPLFEPAFIRLAHELGHAVHNIRGLGLSSSWGQNDPAFGGSELEQDLWTSPEEHQNITKQENPIRKENNLPERKYHKTVGTARASRIRIPLVNRFNQLYNLVPPQIQGFIGRSHFGPLQTAIHQTDFSNQQAANAIRLRVNQLGTHLPAYMKIAWGKFVLDKAWKNKGKVAVGIGTIVLTGNYLWNKYTN